MDNYTKQNKFRLPALYTVSDLVLLFLVGASTVGFYGFRLWRERVYPDQQVVAVVRSGDEIIARLDLARDTTFQVKGALSEVTIVVEKGSLRFKDAGCPLGICEKTPPISRRGSMVVCAPNRVFARIEGRAEPDSKELDAVSR